MSMRFTRGYEGGGGYVCAIDFSSNGAYRVNRGDVHGANVYDSNLNQWVQVINRDSMPLAYSAKGISGEGPGRASASKRFSQPRNRASCTV